MQWLRKSHLLQHYREHDTNWESHASLGCSPTHSFWLINFLIWWGLLRKQLLLHPPSAVAGTWCSHMAECDPAITQGRDLANVFISPTCTPCKADDYRWAASCSVFDQLSESALSSCRVFMPIIVLESRHPCVHSRAEMWFPVVHACWRRSLGDPVSR